MWREWETFDHSVLMLMSPSNFFPQNSRNVAEDEVNKMKEPEEIENTNLSVHSIIFYE